MKIIEYTFKNEMALHARPTTILISEANKFKSDIIIEKDNMTINAKSLISVLSLLIEKGDTIKIKIDGPDEDKAADAIKEILKNIEE
ncbi:HPr family phosphocarrier protein [Thermobrachium celere]|uniref:Phosphotransferase system, phosphocarrier protein HPr n=1 Tax=Thermobrachium celere DSM 8682 TaxID=941824 RepID=R7RQT9_9CLOT|nr:HPr family phosphocarrier protein [Thermobrachium celere]CDF57658.1 Phosphotransferase system, phosphocarrier protein HPr [Thermobrachium celere DSM 8682]